MIWMVIWVVLMLFWLFVGGYHGYDGKGGSARSTIVPWLCVLILGLVVFGALPVGPGLR